LFCCAAWKHDFYCVPILIDHFRHASILNAEDILFLTPVYIDYVELLWARLSTI
jgi:hypothetical protein